MDDRHLAALVGGLDKSGDLLVREGRPLHFIGGEIVLDELDEVGSFGDAGVDEGLQIRPGLDGRDAHPELRAMAARDGAEDARRDKEGLHRRGGPALGGLDLLQQIRTHEHVDEDRDAEGQALLEGVRREDVVMGVDEAGQEGPALAVNDRDARGGRQVCAHGGDAAVADEDVRLGPYALAIEDAHAANKEGRGGGGFVLERVRGSSEGRHGQDGPYQRFHRRPPSVFRMNVAMSSTTCGATLPCLSIYSSGDGMPSASKKRWLHLG